LRSIFCATISICVATASGFSSSPLRTRSRIAESTRLQHDGGIWSTIHLDRPLSDLGSVMYGFTSRTMRLMRCATMSGDEPSCSGCCRNASNSSSALSFVRTVIELLVSAAILRNIS